MSARDTILASMRRSLGVTGREATRWREVADRLAGHPQGLIPARGQLAARECLDQFCRMVAFAAGTVEVLPSPADVPAAVAAFLRAKNLPMRLMRGADPRLSAMPWADEGTLDVAVGASDGQQLVGVSHAMAGVAETGTVVLCSGPHNPTTLNFLPDTHIVIVSESDIVGDYESAWQRLREMYGVGLMPRAVNLVTGPSRSADIEQKLILGAHGPRQLHVMVVGRLPQNTAEKQTLPT